MNTKAYDYLMSQVTTKGEYPREGEIAQLELSYPIVFSSENLQDWGTTIGLTKGGTITINGDNSLKMLFEVILDQIHDMIMSDNEDDGKLFHEDLVELVDKVRQSQTKTATIASRITKVSKLLLKISSDPVKDKMRQQADRMYRVLAKERKSQ